MEHAKDYRWCGYAAAIVGLKVARFWFGIVAEAVRGLVVSTKAWLSDYRLLLFDRGEEAGLDKIGLRCTAG